MTRAFPVGVGVGVATVIALGAALIVRADSKTNKIALSSSPKPVSYVEAHPAAYQPSRVYVGTIRPWNEANIGPQFVAAYVGTVLVRPGASVTRNEVLATLDCRNASAQTQAIAKQASAIEAQEKASADVAARKKSMLEKGYIAEADVVTALAQAEAQNASLAAQRAQLAQSSLQMDDCILRAPFDSEVSARYVDPGGFARPGTPVVSVVDRTIVRVTVDVPEIDFDYVAKDTPVRIHVVSTNKELTATISRRAPSADPGTRTIHVEIDVPDPSRSMPVNTTAEVSVDVGHSVPAIAVPISAATAQNGKAIFYSEQDGVAHLRALPLLGEIGGSFYFDPSLLTAGTRVVTEGRELLHDHDPVAAKAAFEEKM